MCIHVFENKKNGSLTSFLFTKKCTGLYTF